MKLREVKELRIKEVEELYNLEDDLALELFQARVKHGVGQLENTSRLKELRKDIARVRTELRERELKEDTTKGQE